MRCRQQRVMPLMKKPACFSARRVQCTAYHGARHARVRRRRCTVITAAHVPSLRCTQPIGRIGRHRACKAQARLRRRHAQDVLYIFKKMLDALTKDVEKMNDKRCCASTMSPPPPPSAVRCARDAKACKRCASQPTAIRSRPAPRMKQPRRRQKQKMSSAP